MSVLAPTDVPPKSALVYLKAVETDTDSLGNTAEITLGYSIVSR